MGLTTEGMTPADFAAVTNNNDGFGGNGAWWIIILFLFAFAGGWGNGYGGNQGAANNYVLASDFATIQRQLSDGFGGVEKGIDTIRNGLCDGFYTEARLVDGVNQNIAGLGNQLQKCCCDNRYDALVNANNIQNAVNTGFCQTNFNNQQNTRDVIENQNANARAILDAMNQNKVEALKERIAEQNQQINALNLAASQLDLFNRLRPAPVPAFAVPAPYQYGCGCNNGCC